MSALLVALGAAIGAPLRFLADKHLVGRLLRGSQQPLPWGTFAVNVAGSFVLGLMTGVADQTWTLLIGVGFCGAFTTYSTFAAETTALAGSGLRIKALLNVILNLGIGLFAALAGAAIAT
ncbi:fluoride efflux transporter CrcB [Kribbella sandramycini]|uniref:Fluoride-specific ion channel FluC n=1 Tax=Kribbella sandramycini TaxID=60450 RepID=A0A7Y4NWR3_9ACTN|nr:fluoride efflux transporter CrcB [Kribbella sandramycini]MBB6568317.1 CrcB protein [Kribbella sandramycini]NOL39092.1 fluoride efflux transporter CrcB [Kribbella sandramycini]